jgi:D-sedoheptulose 7-phosphate isomerase
MSVTNRIEHYVTKLRDLCSSTQVSDERGNVVPLGVACDWVAEQARKANASGNKLIFVGNGGSAAIASHQAIDYSKNGGIRALALNDAASLTCLANDFGYEHVFSQQIEMHGRSGDVLIAISSSGRSPNILGAAAAARPRDMSVVTFSGFQADNPLRTKGDINFYVASGEYGFVEISHLTLLHAILDLNLIPAKPA